MNGGELLRAWRGERSQAEAAAELKIDQSTLARLESGKVEPRITLALRIRKVAGVPIEAWPRAEKRGRRRSQAA